MSTKRHLPCKIGRPFGSAKAPRNGNSRVVIDNLSPCIDDGLRPSKCVVGEKVAISAYAYADGHDLIRVFLRYRIRGHKDWHESEMSKAPPKYPDKWLGSFTPDRNAIYEYNIIAWIDHFKTWREGLKKKVASQVANHVDLLIGADLIEVSANGAPPSDRGMMHGWSETLRAENVPLPKRLELALSDTVNDLVTQYPDRSLSSTYGCNPPVIAERKRAAFSAWYEFFPRSWGDEPGEHGTFDSCQKILPEIARMGFDIIYLPPIHPIGKVNRKGKNNSLTPEPDDVGCPWAIGSDEGGHKAILPALGTMEDFQMFIWKAGEIGLEVAIDIAFQCAPDHPYVKEHPQWFKWRPDGTVQYAENPPKKYEDVLPFNFETDDWEALWNELLSIFVFWIEKGVKIFRVDNPHTKAIQFWDWVIAEIKQEYPEVIFLAEAFTRPTLKYRLGKAGYTHGYTYFTWRNTKEEIQQYMDELHETRDYFWPNFWPNTPDILTETLQYGGRPAFIVRLILAATLSSNYGMYGPAFELMEYEPFPGKEEYNNNEKYQIRDWDWDRKGNLKDLIARVNWIRKDNTALQRTFNIYFVNTDNPQILAYIKSDPDADNVILVVVNLDFYNVQMGWLELPLEHLDLSHDQPFLVQDLLPDSKMKMPMTNYMWQGHRNFIKLDPQESPAHVFKVFRKLRREEDFDYWL